MKDRQDEVTECGCCGAYHRKEYSGDCRNDAERFGSPEEYNAIMDAAPMMFVALKECKAWLNAVLDTTAENIEDFITNNTEDIEGRVGDALPKFYD